MDKHKVLSVLLSTVYVLEVFGVSARYRRELEVVPLSNNLTLSTDSVCGEEQFLSRTSRTQILFLYNGALVTGPCVLHITNADGNWHSMICIELRGEYPNFDCLQIFTFYFGDYPPQTSSTYYSCKNIRQRVCKTERSVHIIFHPSTTSNKTSRLKFQIKISTTNHIDKRSSLDSWSSWNNWSPWSSSWSSWNNWSPWSSSGSSWSAWSSTHEKEEKERKGGSAIPIIVMCVFGLFVMFMTYVVCCKLLVKKHRGENHCLVSVQRPENSAVSENSTLHSEVQTSGHTRDVNASMLSEISSNNANVNRLPNGGQGDVNQNHFPTITSLIEDYVTSRDQHTVRQPETDREMSAEDIHVTSHHGPGASSQGTPPTLTSLIEEYIATREHPETPGGQETPVSSSVQSSTRAAVNDSVPMQAILSTTDISGTSQHDPSVTRSVPGPTITTLIDEYIATRHHPQASDQRATASLPSTQATSLPATHADVTSAHANISTTAGPSPSLSTLIEEYLSTRTSRVPSEQRHGHSPLQDNQQTSIEPPQYSDVISGRILVHVDVAPPARSGGNVEDVAPPSYESLFGENES